jgi:biopolymer transport protein ExbD
MSHAIVQSSNGYRPIAEINTTPLIDVMLVLLIMLVITIPLATNAVEVDLPKGGAAPQTSVNTIVVTQGGQVLWNGAPVSDAELSGRLVATTLLDPEPQLRFEPEARAAYGRTARVLWQIKQSGVTNFGFSGNERYRTFDSGS